MLELFKNVDKILEALFSKLNKGGVLVADKLFLWQAGYIAARPFGS